MKELIIKKGDKQITLADKEDVMDALEDKSDKNHDHDLKDLNIYADGQGGTNLIEATQNFNTPLTNVGLRDGTYQNCTYRRVDNTSGTNYLDIHLKIPAGTFKHGEKYTLSFWAKGTGNIAVYNYGGTNCIKAKAIKYSDRGSTTSGSIYNDGNVKFALTSEWKRYFITWELNPTNNSTNDISVNKTLILRTIAGADAYWAGVMYERGEIPHDWSPSPKDIPRENITASSTSIANLNHYRKAGFYYNNNNNEAKYIIHCPNSDGTDTPYTNNHSFFLLVEDWGSVADSVKQTLTYYDDDTIYIRRYVNGNWGTWEKTLNSSNYSTYANKTTIVNNLTTTTAGSALDATQGKALNDSIDNLSEQVDDIVAGDVNLTNYAKKDDSRIVDAQERYDGYKIQNTGVNLNGESRYLRIFNIKSSGNNSSSSHLIFEAIGLNNDKLYGKFRVDLRSYLLKDSNDQYTIPYSQIKITPLEFSPSDSKWVNKFYFARHQNGLNVDCDVFFEFNQQYDDTMFRIYDGHTRDGTVTQLYPVVNGEESYIKINPDENSDTDSAAMILYDVSYDEVKQGVFVSKADKFVKADGQSTEFLKADGSVDTNTYAKSSDLTSAKIVDTNTYSNINNTAQTQKGINEAINNRLAALNDLDLVKVVGSKPTPSANTMNKLYLTTESPSVEEDEYEIFITVRSGSSGNYTYAWEKVDTARVNLSDYVQTNDTRLTDKRAPINNAITANSDLDDFKDTGFYYCQGDAEVAPTIVNQPLTSSGQRSFSMIVELISSSPPRVVQKLTYYSTKDTYIRTNINNTWSTWNRVLHSGNYSDYANKTTVTDNLTTDSSTNALSAKQGKILNDRYKGIAISGANVPSKPYLRLFNIESTASSSSGHLIFEIFGINNDSSYAKVRVDLRRNNNSPPSGTCAVVPLNISNRTTIYDNLYFAHYIDTNKSYVDIFFKTIQYRDCIFKVYDDQLRNGKYTMYKPIVAANAANDVETYTTVEAAGTALYNASYTNIINKSYNDIVASSFIKDGGTSSQFLKADGSVDSNTYSTSNHNHDTTYIKTGTGTVTSTNIADKTIVNGDIADATITGGKLVDGTITNAKIGNNQVNNAKLSDNAVTTAKITDANVTTAKIADSAVTSAKIADKTIVNGDIADNAAIDYSKLSGVASSTHNHNSDYVKLSGSQTMTGNILIPSNADSSNNYATGNIPYAGTITDASSVQNFCETHKSFIGVINDGTWRHLISSRHRNGAGDGNNYGFYISSDNDVNGHLKFNKEWHNVWGTERTILDSSNYSNYANKTTVSDNLTDTSTTNALSANQGKVLKGLVDGKSDTGHKHYSTKITSGEDLNDIKKQGFYFNDMGTASTILHNPNGKAFFLLVEDWGTNAYSVKQTFTSYSPNETYIRMYVNGNWSSWLKILDSSNYSDYANKTTVTDNLTTDSSTNALSAKQGKWLYDNKANKSSYVTCTVTYADGSTGTINLVTR